MSAPRKERLVGRERELQALESAWARACSGQPQVVTVWGNRRVGKTHVLSHFATGKTAVWFGATREADAVELGRLIRAVEQECGRGIAQMATSAFRSWRAALRFIGTLAVSSPLLVVVDRAGSLMRSSPDFVEGVRCFVDEVPAHAKVMLVVIGGSNPDPRLISGPQASPRTSLCLRLEPLVPRAARRLLPHLRPAEFLEAYAACGGYPVHLLQWEAEATVEENLLRLAGTPGGILTDAAETILRDLLPDDAVGYTRILAAIGRTQTRYSEIAVAADQRIDHPLDVLIRHGLVRRSVPVGAAATTHTCEYQLTDTYLAYWFRVLYPIVAEVDAGRGAAALRRSRQLWARHVATVFQDVARNHVRRLAERGEVPDDLVVGRWWSLNRDQEVEVLALRDGRALLLGEAQWSERPLTLADLASLQSRVPYVPRPVAQPLFALWGRCGVAPEVRSYALGFDVDVALGE